MSTREINSKSKVPSLYLCLKTRSSFQYSRPIRKQGLEVCSGTMIIKLFEIVKIQKFPRDFKKASTPIVAIEVVTTQAKILSSGLSLS